MDTIFFYASHVYNNKPLKCKTDTFILFLFFQLKIAVDGAASRTGWIGGLENLKPREDGR